MKGRHVENNETKRRKIFQRMKGWSEKTIRHKKLVTFVIHLENKMATWRSLPALLFALSLKMKSQTCKYVVDALENVDIWKHVLSFISSNHDKVALKYNANNFHGKWYIFTYYHSLMHQPPTCMFDSLFLVITQIIELVGDWCIKEQWYVKSCCIINTN